MNISAEMLYNLLPSIYRIRDAENGEPLKALVEIVAAQAKLIEDDISQLYKNWFIETCDEWVVPYIGDLLAVKGLHPFDNTAAFSQRARVANTISYRRRKGTATMLEQLAYDTTGWRARAVEYFQLLETTQYYNHIRLSNLRTPDLRLTNELELIDTAFDKAAHTAEVRNIKTNRGYYNIPNVGIFLWRLQSYFIDKCSARSAADIPDGRYRFNQLGIDMNLFNRPQTETEITSLAKEINVPGKLRRRPLFDELESRRQSMVDNPSALRDALINLREALINNASFNNELEDLNNVIVGGGTALFEDLQSLREKLLDGTIEFSDALEIIFNALTIDYNVDGIYFGSQPVVQLFVKNADDHPLYQIIPEEILICNLSEPPTAIPEIWMRPPEEKYYQPTNGTPELPVKIKVAVDPVQGRIAFPADVVPTQLHVSYAYGFSGDMGGGPYNRQDSIKEEITRSIDWQVGVSKMIEPEPGIIFSSLAEAINEWNNIPQGKFGIITMLDNDSYDEDLSVSKIKIPQGTKLIIAAAKWDEKIIDGIKTRIAGEIDADELRPHIKSDIYVSGGKIENNSSPGELVLDGLLVEGKLNIQGKAGEQLGSVKINHCNFVPENGGIKVPSSISDLEIIVNRSICGSIQISKSILRLRVEESIVDNGNNKAINAKGVNADIQKSTIFGETECLTLNAGNSIFTGKITAKRSQSGCVRFCYIPDKSKTPRRYNCQPDLAIQKSKKSLIDFNKSRIIPSFTSEIFGNYAYAQLNVNSAIEIKTGAEDGSEMGAFSFLKQPQREINLRTSLDEYLRFGIEAGLIFVT